MIRATKLIAWDKAPMMNYTCYELVDSLLRDIMGEVDPALQEVPFGGKIVVSGGDMRQVLPVVQCGSRAIIVNACINNSICSALEADSEQESIVATR